MTIDGDPTEENVDVTKQAPSDEIEFLMERGKMAI